MAQTKAERKLASALREFGKIAREKLYLAEASGALSGDEVALDKAIIVITAGDFLPVSYEGRAELENLRKFI